MLIRLHRYYEKPIFHVFNDKSGNKLFTNNFDHFILAGGAQIHQFSFWKLLSILLILGNRFLVLWDKQSSLIFLIFLQDFTMSRSSRQEVFCKKGVLRNFTKFTCTRASFLIKLQAKACNFIKKETVAQAFSCEFWKISKDTFLYETPRVAASVCPLQETSYFLWKQISMTITSKSFGYLLHLQK